MRRASDVPFIPSLVTTCDYSFYLESSERKKKILPIIKRDSVVLPPTASVVEAEEAKRFLLFFIFTSHVFRLGTHRWLQDERQVGFCCPEFKYRCVYVSYCRNRYFFVIIFGSQPQSMSALPTLSTSFHSCSVILSEFVFSR